MFGFKSKPQYRTGLALSGGGARGLAHAGAFKAMEEVGLRPDILAGVSAGSVAAVMYAAGISPEQMLDIFRHAKFTDFCEFGMPNGGFLSLDRFRDFLRHIIPYENLEDLPIKTVVGATDFDNARPVFFDKGPIAERVVASCSIPIVFKPVTIDGVRYVDGGVLHNLPAWTIRKQCKVLIGINCSPLSDIKAKNSVMSVAMRSYELLAKTNAIPDMALCDMVVRTDRIARYQVFNLKELDKVFESGYRDTLNHLLYHGFKRRVR
ncbi:MAG: patatin-like phospholipase family protein [Muribaculaceae bacterium]|nr:patatin-like phospholipase family protein [Muribaculaceae bacterium]